MVQSKTKTQLVMEQIARSPKRAMVMASVESTAALLGISPQAYQRQLGESCEGIDIQVIGEGLGR